MRIILQNRHFGKILPKTFVELFSTLIEVSEKAADVVESKRIRYMVRKGVAESIGDKVVELFNKYVKKDSENIQKEEISEQESAQNSIQNKTSKKKNKKGRGNRQR